MGNRLQGGRERARGDTGPRSSAKGQGYPEGTPHPNHHLAKCPRIKWPRGTARQAPSQPLPFPGSRKTTKRGLSPPLAASGSTCNPLQQLPLVQGASRQARLVPSSQRAIVEWTGKSVMGRIGPTPFPDKGGAVLPARSRTLACARVDLRRGNSSRGGLPPQY
jgi:hypothetical protein